MHKPVAVLALAVVISARPASAQLTLGLVAGGTSASTSSDGLGRLPISSVTGFTGGLSLTVPLANHISFAPEILYAMKGTTDKLAVATSSNVMPYETGTSKISYVEVPVLLRVNVGSGFIRPFVTAGPEVAFKVGCNFTVAGTLSFGNGEFGCSQSTLAAESGVKSTDVGALVGGGLAIGRMSISVRYDMSFSNSSQDTYGGYAKNRAFMAIVGVTP
jgi:hypothetical protein